MVCVNFCETAHTEPVGTAIRYLRRHHGRGKSTIVSRTRCRCTAPIVPVRANVVDLPIVVPVPRGRQEVSLE